MNQNGQPQIHGTPWQVFADWHEYDRRGPWAGNAVEEVRQRYNFIVVGFVVMPEHFHILMSEPKTGSLSLVMQVLKQRVARKCRRKRRSMDQLRLGEESGPAFWQTRYYDFNVYSGKKKIQKLRYMHRNPVKRGLVTTPEEWRWSSYRYYRFGEEGPVKIGK
jgi:putative transposase